MDKQQNHQEHGLHKEHEHHEEHGHNNGGHDAHGHGSHDHHAMMIWDFRKRFWLSTIISIPILVFSPMIQDFMGYELLLPGNKYIMLILSTFVYFWG
ncbi:MAG: hypothetical protein WC341_14955, partial [Bacteroidales bacterium]